MKISSFWFWQTPQNLKGTIVIIDVYLMTTNLAILLAGGPKRLLIVNERNFKKAQKLYPETVLIGESPIFPLSTFEATFPSELAKADFKDKTLLYMTLNGSRVFEKFYQRDRFLVGLSFNNLKVVVDFLRNKEEITIIKAGDVGRELVGDQVCSDILKAELQGKDYDWQEEKAKIIDFFKNYYGHSQERDESMAYIFDKDGYDILPVCKRNKEGFLEIVDFSRVDKKETFL